MVSAPDFSLCLCRPEVDSLQKTVELPSAKISTSCSRLYALSEVLLHNCAMYRVSSDTNYNPLGDISENHDDLERSYSSAISASTNNASSSSKAVLAALRALQDKIRRLEIERSQALDESAQLKQQLKNQEAEAEHTKQKENLSAQKSLQEARHAYERLLSEKTELELRLGRLEDKNRTSHGISEDLQAKIKNYEEEKQAGAARIKELEHQHHQLDIQIRNAQQKEKGMLLLPYLVPY